MSKTNDAWTLLDKALDLSSRVSAHESVRVSASQIKLLTREEPRLVTKFDFRESRPEVLRNLNAAILPETNGEYVVVNADAYYDLPTSTTEDVQRLHTDARYVSLPEHCSSESQAIDVALAHGVLSHFLEDQNLTLTVRGRLRSKRWDYSLGALSTPLSVDGVQIEVDAGYEGDSIYLLEAKMGLQSNVIGRQLYFPFRDWSERQNIKRVVPILLCYSDRQFHLFHFSYSDPGDYSSALVTKYGVYQLTSGSDVVELDGLLSAFPITFEPLNIPFPQADNFQRVIDLIDISASRSWTDEDLALRFGFDPRQSQYYGNAAAYLGMVRRTAHGVRATEVGRNFFLAGSNSARLRMLGGTMCQRPIIRSVLAHVCATGRLPSLDFIADQVGRHRPNIRKRSTQLRRAQTVVAWTRWLISKLGE